MPILDEREVELKRLAVQLTVSMLDNHNGEWDDEATARAFRTLYEALRQV